MLIDKHCDVLAVSVHPANVADSTAAQELLQTALSNYPTLERMLANSAYECTGLREFIENELGLELDTTSPPLPKGKNFVPRPLRWRIEQYFSWLARWRRIAKNWCFTATGFTREVRWCVFGTALRRAASSR